MEFFGKAAELLESLDKAATTTKNANEENEKIAGSSGSDFTSNNNTKGSSSSNINNSIPSTISNNSSTSSHNSSSSSSFIISAEEQISQGYHRETALRSEVAALRQRLGEVDFDAVHRVRTECDVLSQRLAALSRDYESLRSSSEGQAQSSQIQISALTRENEALETRISQQVSSARAREDALLEDVALLSQELQTRATSFTNSTSSSSNSLSSSSSSSTSNGDERGGLTRAAAAAAQIAAVDDAIALASKPLQAQLTLERARVAEIEQRERTLLATCARDRAAEAEARQLFETSANEIRELSSRNALLEAELVKLRASQGSVTSLQRLASESARESAAATAQLSELRSRSKAATSLLAQEQLSHQATRAAYEELQRMFATSTRASGATSATGARGDRLPTRTGPMSSSGVATSHPLAAVDRAIVSGLALLASNKRARIIVLAYFAFLQFWALFLIFAQHQSLPHSMHTAATRP